MLIRISFIALFAALTYAPLAQMLTRLVPEMPVIENRALAPLPSALQVSYRVAREANDWFNDHFGLRSLLIRIKTQIDYSLFRTSDRVHIGHHGWLFYRSVLDVERPNIENYLTRHSQEVRDGIVALSAAFKRNGIQTIFVVNEMADRFYPDMVPRSALPAPSDPKIRQLSRDLAGVDGLDAIDATQLLSEVARERQVFHKTDFHWNDPAAFAVAQRIVTLASAAEGRPTSAWSHRLEIGTEKLSGGIASFMPLLRTPSEQALVVKPSWALPLDFRQDKASGIFEFSIHFPRTGPTLLKPVVMLGDSFTDGFTRSGIYLSFSDTYRIRWDKLPKLSVLARELPGDTKHVVVQMIEVQLQALWAFADREDVALAAKTLDERFGGEQAKR
jgi:hypothetical protein